MKRRKFLQAIGVGAAAAATMKVADAANQRLDSFNSWSHTDVDAAHGYALDSSAPPTEFLEPYEFMFDGEIWPQWRIEPRDFGRKMGVVGVWPDCAMSYIPDVPYTQPLSDGYEVAIETAQAHLVKAYDRGYRMRRWRCDDCGFWVIHRHDLGSGLAQQEWAGVACHKCTDGHYGPGQWYFEDDPGLIDSCPISV